MSLGVLNQSIVELHKGVDDFVIGKDRTDLDVKLSVSDDGYVQIWRATDDPNRLVISDFTKTGGGGRSGLGEQNYFSPTPEYANEYGGYGRRVYQFETKIKPNEILNIDIYYLRQSHPELVPLFYDESPVSGPIIKKGNIQSNIGKLKELGYKAVGTSATGNQRVGQVQFEIIPLIEDLDDIHGIKPIAVGQGGLPSGKGITWIPLEDTPTNVVDDLTPNQLADNFFNSLNRNTTGNVELYLRHAGTNVSANEIKFSHKMGGANLIPGFYTEPIGNKTLNQIRGPGNSGDAVDNFYKVQVNTDNLLINIQEGEFRGRDRFVATSEAGRSRLMDQIEKIDWDIFAKETGLSFDNLVEISPNSFGYNDVGKRVAFVDIQTFTKILAREVGDTELAFTSLRKAGIEGFVEGPTNAQYEVVLLDPNDDLGIGKRINIEDTTVEQFKTSQATANPIDEISVTPEVKAQTNQPSSLDAAKVDVPDEIVDVPDEIVEKQTNVPEGTLKRMFSSVPGYAVVPLEQLVEDVLSVTKWKGAVKPWIKYELQVFGASIVGGILAAIAGAGGAWAAGTMGPSVMNLSAGREVVPTKKIREQIPERALIQAIQIGGEVMSNIVKASPSYWIDEYLLKKYEDELPTEDTKFMEGGWQTWFPQLGVPYAKVMDRYTENAEKPSYDYLKGLSK